MARPSNPMSNAALDRPKGGDLRVLKQVLGFLAPYKLQVFLALVALTVTAGAVLGLGQGLRALIDSGFAAGNPEALDQALIFLITLSVVMAFGTYARFFLVSWLGERVVADLRASVFDRILALHPGFFETTKTGEILSRLTTDTTLLQSIIGSSASMALRNLLIMLGGIVMMTITNPKLTALVMIVVPAVVVPILFIGRRVRKLSRASQDRVADVGAFAEESINAIQTVQSFTHEAEDRRRFGGEVKAALDTAIQRIKLRASLSAVVILLVFTAIAVILWVGGNDVMSGAITGGELAAFVFYATIVAFSVGIISEVYGELQRAAGATERLIELLEAIPEIISPVDAAVLDGPIEGRVRFENVTFHYPSRPDIAALKDFSLDIAPGETVALVGPSGAGKSTVFQLLLRFYDPEDGSGKITLDSHDLRDLSFEDLRGSMALVPQDPVIFGTSARENIRYGDPDADDHRVQAAAKAAAADGFIEEMPEGYDTFLGQRGLRLSGGQRQRLSIARAVLRNPAVLLLDEATSALDAENEHLVQNALEELMRDRTTLVIAHRLATVMNADRIIVVEKGAVIATGTHNQLIKSNSLYRRLAELQFNQPEQPSELVKSA